MDSMEEKGRRHQIKKRAVRIFVYFLLTIAAIISLFPLYWMLLTSLTPTDEIFIFPPKFWPSRIAWENYATAWNSTDMGRYYINSIIVTFFTTGAHVVFACITAYAFVCIRFPGRETIFMIFLGTMMIPHVVNLIPSFILLKWLGWINTYQGLIIPHAISVFGIFLLRQFFMGIPKDYEDAAKIDGCGRLGILWRMYIPLAKPAISALTIFSFYHVWNDFFWPLVITSTEDMRTLQIGLRYYLDAEGGSGWELVMAAGTMVVAPVLLAFFILQKQFVRGITMTGLKG